MELMVVGLLGVGLLVLAALYFRERSWRNDGWCQAGRLADGNAQLVEQLKKAKLKPDRGALIYDDREAVERGLNVQDDDPLLRAILSVLSAREQDHIERGSVGGLPADEAKAELRCVTCLQETAEIILEEVATARELAK